MLAGGKSNSVWLCCAVFTKLTGFGNTFVELNSINNKALLKAKSEWTLAQPGGESNGLDPGLDWVPNSAACWQPGPEQDILSPSALVSSSMKWDDIPTVFYNFTLKTKLDLM